MLKTIYDSIECRVRINGKDSEPFQILVGLLQGDSNSTILFNIVFAVILQITNQRLENIGIKLRLRIDKKFFKVLQSKAKGEIINILDFIFADDTCLCTENEEDLQLAIQTFAEVCVLFGLTISVDKTEFMIQRASNNYTHNELSISIEGKNVKQVTSFKYLGSMVTADATINKEIQTRIQKASAAFSKLFQRVWSRNTLSLKTKVSVYKTMILPILTQDCETWNAKQSHYRKLESCQYKFLRTICNKKWEHFVAYSELFDILDQKNIQLPSVEILVRKKKLDLLYKILCMDNSRLVKRVAFSDTVEGKRRVGRPLFSWRQAINQDLKIFGLQHIIHLDENAQKQALRIGTNEKCFLNADMNWKKLRKQKRLLRKTRNSSS